MSSSLEEVNPTPEVGMTQELHSPPDADINEVERPWAQLLPLHQDYHSIDLIAASYVFGRHTSSDFLLKDPSASNTHCRIFQEMDDQGSSMLAFLEDLSSNGTFINDRKVGKGKRQVLNHGDEISVAHPKRKIYSFHDLSNAADRDTLTDCDEINARFGLRKVLGRGASGEVKLAVDRATGEQFAVKIIPKSKANTPKQKESVLSEGRILSTISHPSIIRVFDMFETPNTFYIVLELVNGGELFDLIVKESKFKDAEAKFLFRQMLLAVKLLHDNDIAHRDLKPENILITQVDDDTLIKLSDFGLAKLVGDANQFRMQTLCGTPNYLAPEVLIGAGQKAYSNVVDMWSLGVILFICLCGYPPFSEEITTHTLHEQITKGILNFIPEYWKNVSPDAVDLIKQLIQVDPSKRLTAAAALEHPWLQDEAVTARVDDLYRRVAARSVAPAAPVAEAVSRSKRPHEEDDAEDEANPVAVSKKPRN
ncbi:checkpoint and tumor suppressor protein 2 [Capsaspora owczarzaki ATCC 30864]|uniref:CAMK/RAD53 protein kinase n=1 Tax=Capsaspora owczarzaki (strain ATCC 30864) TaxID=595528 RepID=A0A0D2WMH0_CAPO3|nr:checkpoint and tumor suppressor protein 2 [Capsaspora owczarzaki ATCC 30864]KJE92025.1 CAMK/RAD53 protein kinase [Capsaspora owczarzaki ATCC 30864]|eukprot:XP_004363900.1 checkpoint and tumor suppressor protein 2 [Capsaspora owczarzaki ATCC 30864]